MEFLFRIKADNGSYLEIDNEGVTMDLDDQRGMVIKMDANWEEMQQAATRAVRLIDPEGEIVPIELDREPQVPVFPDLKGYQVPLRIRQN